MTSHGETGITLTPVHSDWPLLVTAAPDRVLQISFMTDGETVEKITCTQMAVLSCVHEEQELFSRDPWVDRLQQGIDQERKRIVDLLRSVETIPGWVDGTQHGLLQALARLLEGDHDGLSTFDPDL